MKPEKPARPSRGRPETNPLKAPPASPVYRPLGTLADLEKVCDQPVVVEAMVGEDRFRFEGRRLKPCEERRVKELMEAAFPPELPPDQPGGEPRYDFRNAEYLAVRETNRRKARALVLYLAFPIFREAVPALPGGRDPTVDEIMEAIESRPLDVSVLDLAHETVMREVVMVDARRVGFISGGNSPAS